MVSSVLALAAVLAGCGGAVSPAQSDAIDAGRSVEQPPPGACPSDDELARGTAVGKRCAAEGAYCANGACDPCTTFCPAVSCDHGVWKTPATTAVCARDGNGDASAPPNQCVTIDPKTYDQSCQDDGDCFLISAGTFCPDTQQCACPNDTISVTERARYTSAFSTIAGEEMACPCAALGTPRCVQNRCTLCGPGGSSPGCPDAG